MDRATQSSMIRDLILLIASVLIAIWSALPTMYDGPFLFASGLAIALSVKLIRRVIRSA